MFTALRDDAATLVASLWLCGLTATLHLRQNMGIFFDYLAAIFLDTKKKKSSIPFAITVANKAFLLHELPLLPEDDPNAALLRLAVRRRHSKPREEKTAISEHEVVALTTALGSRPGSSSPTAPCSATTRASS